MKPNPAKQKLRGGYYTPRSIATFLAGWAIRSPDDAVLEPSCGDGNILEAAILRLAALGSDLACMDSQLCAVEFDRDEAEKARQRSAGLGASCPRAFIHHSDFFSLAREQLFPSTLLGETVRPGRTFAAAIGNPPFIRYQNFPEDHRVVAFDLMARHGLHPNRLTNAWLPFVVLSAHLLNDHGRLGMVVPAELFQVNYAAEVRRFLSEFFHSVTLVTFQRLLFDGVQQEVVLLLGQRDGASSSGIRTIELESAEDLESFNARAVERTALKPLDHNTEKWTKYFLNVDEIALLRELRARPDVTRSGDVLDVDVGVVTGNNKYFVLQQRDAERLALEDAVIPIVTRSAHLRGTLFSNDDWQRGAAKAGNAVLFRPVNAALDRQPQAVREYIEHGEQDDQHTGYKCRIRKRWFVIPSVWRPDAFLLRQVYDYPKLVANESDATCTDTIHRVRMRGGWAIETVAAAFMNSLTLAYAEVKGRSYGGGVLTFEPTEAEDLPIPLANAEAIDVARVDRLVRAGEIDAVLDMTDAILLRRGLGLSGTEVTSLRNIWKKLRDRRNNRR